MRVAAVSRTPQDTGIFFFTFPFSKKHIMERERVLEPALAGALQALLPPCHSSMAASALTLLGLTSLPLLGSVTVTSRVDEFFETMRPEVQRVARTHPLCGSLEETLMAIPKVWSHARKQKPDPRFERGTPYDLDSGSFVTPPQLHTGRNL